MPAMIEGNHSNKKSKTLAELYPNLTPEELKEAEDNLDRYIDLSLRIFAHVKANPEEYGRFKALTAKKPYPTMNNDDPILPDLSK
jgi:hypothetical protein